MSYTSIDIIKHHLDIPFPITDKVDDQAVVIFGNDYVTFFGGSLDASSVSVKSIQDTTPQRLTIVLSSTTTSIISTPIVPGSVVAASNSSMSEVYIENQDFIIDYQNGNLIIKSGGVLSVGNTVTVWYVPYIVYSAGSDYRINSTAGEIQRITSGNIADGETVFIDYTPVFSNLTEDVLSNAAKEANGLIEKTIDPDQQFGADPILQTAATYKSLEIVCRSSAMRELSSGRNNNRAAAVWMKLADKYQELSKNMLNAFIERPSNPSQPIHS
jgi:hypothetical protein